MGGFANILGHVAGGFEQARQQDLSRQFADEQNRRSMASELLGHIALDPNQPDEVRTPFLDAYMNLAQLPPDKKFDFKKHMAPAFDAMAQYRMKLQAAKTAQANQPAPTPAIQLGTPPAPPTSGVNMTNTGGAPQISAPPHALAFAEPGVQPPAPPPLPEFLSSAAAIAQQQAHAAGQKQAEEITAASGARKGILQDMPIAPEAKAGLILGLPMAGAMTRTLDTGIGTAGEYRAMGYDVPKSIPDSQNVNYRKTLTGDQFAPTDATAAGRVSTATGSVSKQEADIAKEQRQQHYWETRNGVQFHQALVKISAQAQQAMDKGDYEGARKIIRDSQVASNNATNRDVTMHKNLDDAMSGNQQAMVSLAGNHVLMITGAGEKGNIRATKLIWEDAVKSAPWMQRIQAKFSKDGYLEGVTLTPEQMKQMVALADEKVQTMHDSTAHLNSTFNQSLAAHTTGTGAPPKPPKAGKTDSKPTNDPLGIR